VWVNPSTVILPLVDSIAVSVELLFAQSATGTITFTLYANDDCTGKIGVMGFCLGGKNAYLASTRLPIEAAVSYYGVQIDQHLDEADRRTCPILMHFASDDIGWGCAPCGISSVLSRAASSTARRLASRVSASGTGAVVAGRLDIGRSADATAFGQNKIHKRP